MQRPRRVVVVGGGITGLAAAHALAQASRPVELMLLERSGRLGGNLRTERVDDFLLDPGPDSWVATRPAGTALVKALSLGGEIVETIPENRRVYIVWNEALHAMPEGVALGVPTQILPMVRTKLFSWPGKLRMGLELFVPRRRFGSDEDESIADFVSRRLGREASDRLAAPLLGGIYAGDAREISVRAAIPQFVEAERAHGSLVLSMRAQRRKQRGHGPAPSAFLSLRGGMGELAGALEARLPRGAVKRGRAVSRIEPLARDARGRFVLVIDGGEKLFADDVLLAVPAFAAAELTRGLDGALAEELGAIPHASTAAVFVAMRRADVEHRLDASGYIVPRVLGLPAVASTWISSKWPGRAPDGSVLLRVFMGGAGREEVLERDDAELVRIAREELASRIGARGEPLFTKVFRFVKASPQPSVGHPARMRRIRERLARWPGLYVAGGGYDGVGIPSCIEQGQAVASSVLAEHAPEDATSVAAPR